MSWETNVYGYPEKHGLTIEAQSWERDLVYEFNAALVLTDGDRYWFVQDSGCSCPSPFEDYDSIESLGPPVQRHEAYDQLAEFEDRYNASDDPWS